VNLAVDLDEFLILHPTARARDDADGGAEPSAQNARERTTKPFTTGL